MRETLARFIELKPNATAAPRRSSIGPGRGSLDKKISRHIAFTKIPKTSTGKAPKFAVRERARNIDQG